MHRLMALNGMHRVMALKAYVNNFKNLCIIVHLSNIFSTTCPGNKNNSGLN